MVLNTFVSIFEDVNKNFEFCLDYCLFLWKTNEKMFQKIHSKGQPFIENLMKSYSSYSELVVKEIKNIASQQKHSIVTFSEKRMLVLDKLKLLQEGEYEEFCRKIVYDFDVVVDLRNKTEIDVK